MTGLVAAARYLTIVPIPGAAPGRANPFGGAAVWFPVVGLGVGAVLVGVERVTALLF
ncbi:MAG: adenosylcobinamide-GDP ribazoletransferase, partial [Candidatus Rokuibacteriota bacterium]